MQHSAQDPCGQHQRFPNTPHCCLQCRCTSRYTHWSIGTATSPYITTMTRTTNDQQATTTLITKPNFSSFLHLLWLSFSVHEQLNIHKSLLEFSTYNAVQLTTSAMPAAEQYKYHTCRHSFLHVPQLLYPSERLDGILG